MSRKNSKATDKNEAPRQERGGLFNPFAELGAQLSSREQAGEHSSRATPAASSPGTGAASGHAPGHASGKTTAGGTRPGNAAVKTAQNHKTGNRAQTASETSDSADAALFQRTVDSQGFRPIKKDAPGKRGNPVAAAGTRRDSAASAQEDISMADLLAMQERHSSSTTGSSPKTRLQSSGGAFSAPAAENGSQYATPVAPEQPAQQGREPENGQVTPVNAEEENLFAQAMQGVAPVDGKGRDLPLKKQENKSAPESNQPYLEDFLQGKFEFALEYTDEFFEGHVMGVDPLILSKLRAGQYSPESHVDLHGQNSEQAYESLVTFIRHAYGKGQRSLVVVTGRGKNSPGGLGILRQNMQDWLTKDPLKRVVLAFCTAQPKDGGTGAIYVLLRKYKKSSGKIRWDKSGWGGVGVL